MAKARAGKLKLFKTVIGFHDAYVAAPSQKGALQAWGASTNLFSAGLAERVDNVDSCKAAFDDPGTIVTVKRGTKGEWSKRAKPKPKKPSRSDATRVRLEARRAKLDERHAAALKALDRQAEALRSKRDKLERDHAAARAKLESELAAI